MVKLQYVKSANGDRWSLTIPKDIVMDKGWKKGQRFIVSYNSEGNVVLKAIEG